MASNYQSSLSLPWTIKRFRPITPPMHPIIVQSGCSLYQNRISLDSRIWVDQLSFRPSNDTSKLSSHALIIGSGSTFLQQASRRVQQFRV